MLKTSCGSVRHRIRVLPHLRRLIILETSKTCYSSVLGNYCLKDNGKKIVCVQHRQRLFSQIFFLFKI